MGIAIGYYASHGITVCIPLTDSQDYDLVVEVGPGLRRVQVKTSNHQSRPGRWGVELRVKGGNRTGTGKVKKLNASTIDDVFVVTGDGAMHLIPAAKCPGRSITLGGGKWAKYRVHWPSGGVRSCGSVSGATAAS